MPSTSVRAHARPVLRAVISVGLLGVLAGTSGAAPIADPVADWKARSEAPGVFWKTSFEFSSVQALRSASFGGMSFPERAELETVNQLGTGGALKCNIPKTSDEGTCNWAHSWDLPVGAQTKNIKKKAFYYQFQIYLPKYILDHRFATVGNTSATSHKFAIIQEPDQSFGTGEVVITNDYFRGFVGAYRKRGSNGQASGFEKRVDNSPCNTPDYQWQPAIDGGPQSEGGQTDKTSCKLFKRRYGPIQYSFSGTNKNGAGTLSEQGNPDPDAAVNGAVWAPDAWNVVEVYVNETTNTVRIWHAKRGDPPKLVIDAQGTADLGNRAGNYTGVQLLPRLEELAPDPNRQDTYAIYDEIIASDNFINFPGGFGESTVRPKPPTSVQAE